eukprot:scaffold8437_cov60-Attheya_sp.AAC.1
MNNRNTRRNINQVDSGRGRGPGRDTGRGGRGYRGGYSSGRGSYQGGYGRGGRSGRGGRGEPRKTRNDSTIITLTDGQKVEYHASFNFPDWQFAKFKMEDKEKLRQERDSYKDSKRQSSRTSELQTQLSQANSNNDEATVGQRSHISQVTTGSTMMGGRNEQSSSRQGRNIGAVQTVRHIKTSRPGNIKNLERSCSKY